MAKQKPPVNKTDKAQKPPKSVAADKASTPAPAAPVPPQVTAQPVPPAPKVATPPAPAPVPTPAPEEVDLQDRVSSDADLPQPESDSADVAVLNAPQDIQVEEIPEELPPGVSEESIDMGDTERISADPASDIVQIRALVTNDGCPVVCGFSFENVVGKDARTGRPVKGVFRKDCIYNVPLFVAMYFVEKNWALRV